MNTCYQSQKSIFHYLVLAMQSILSNLLFRLVNKSTNIENKNIEHLYSIPTPKRKQITIYLHLPEYTDRWRCRNDKRSDCLYFRNYDSSVYGHANVALTCHLLYISSLLILIISGKGYQSKRNTKVKKYRIVKSKYRSENWNLSASQKWIVDRLNQINSYTFNTFIISDKSEDTELFEPR